MPVPSREYKPDFDETKIIKVSASAKDWWTAKEAFIFYMKISKEVGITTPEIDLSAQIVQNLLNAAMLTAADHDLTEPIGRDVVVTVAMPQALFLSVFGALDKVAWNATQGIDDSVTENGLTGRGHILDTYHHFQPIAASISLMYSQA